MRALLLFVPIELGSLVIVVAGLAILVGAKTLGRRLLYFAGAMLVIPAVLAPFFDLVPEPLLWLFSVALAVGVLFGLLRATSAALIGRGATDSMSGSLAARLSRWLVKGLVIMAVWPLRLLGRGLRMMLWP